MWMARLIQTNILPAPRTSGSGRNWGTLERVLFGMSQRHYLLGPSSCYPSWWGFFCPYFSLCQESGQWKLWAQVKNLVEFLAGYKGDSLACFSHSFFLLSFSSLLGLKPSQNLGCLASGPNEAQALISHCKNSLKDKAISKRWID